MSGPEEAVSKWLTPTVTSEIMVGVVVTLFLVFLLVFFSYLYTKRYSGAVPAIRSSRMRFVLPADHPAGATARRGLDPQVLRALPITVFRPKDSALECAVCLTEISDGEEARLLPNCSHGFHLECIDMWFHSHSTCPLCRIPVSLPEPPKDPVFGDHLVDISPESTVSDGKQGASSSSGGGSVGGLPTPGSPLPTSRPAVEETKAAMSARLRSLRRLWSRGNRGAGVMCSPRGDGGDVEQGDATPSNP